MSGITATQAQQQLDAWLACSLAIAQGNQSYTIQGREFTKADAAEVRRQIDFWEARVAKLSSGARGAKVRYVVSE